LYPATDDYVLYYYSIVESARSLPRALLKACILGLDPQVPASDHCHTTDSVNVSARDPKTQRQHGNADAIARRRRKWRRAN
jgi:hypothetical protein